MINFNFIQMRAEFTYELCSWWWDRGFEAAGSGENFKPHLVNQCVEWNVISGLSVSLKILSESVYLNGTMAIRSRLIHIIFQFCFLMNCCELANLHHWPTQLHVKCEELLIPEMFFPNQYIYINIIVKLMKDKDCWKEEEQLKAYKFTLKRCSAVIEFMWFVGNKLNHLKALRWSFKMLLPSSCYEL